VNSPTTKITDLKNSKLNTHIFVYFYDNLSIATTDFRMMHMLSNEANFVEYIDLGPVVGANMCARDLLEVKGKGVR
jgi:hypothetical protein